MVPRSSRVGVILLLACLSCSGDDFAGVVGDIPSDVTRVATHLLDARGNVVAASGLVPWSSGSVYRAELPLAGAVHGARIFGFTDADLAALTLPDVDILERDAVELAGSRDPLLPPPSFVGAGVADEGIVQFEGVEDAVDLTQAWLPDCAIYIPRGAAVDVDARCAPKFCATDARQVDCNLDLRFDGCNLDSISGVADGRGEIAFSSTGNLAKCRAATPPSESAMSIECETCRLDFYVEPYPVSLAYDEIRVLDVPTMTGERPGPPFSGYLGGLVVLGDRVLVSHYRGKAVHWLCSPAEPATLEIYDAERLALVRTATAPDCLGRLIRDPTSSGFLATYGHDPSHLGRFDADGNLVQSVPIAPAGANVQHQPTTLWASTRGGGRVLVGLSESTPDGETGTGYLLQFDLTTLALESDLSSDAHYFQTMAELPDGRVVVGGEPDSRVFVIGAPDLRIERTLRVSSAPEVNKGPGHIYADPTLGILEVASGGGQSALHRLTLDEELGLAAFYEAYGSIVESRRFGAFPGRSLVTVLSMPDKRVAYASLLDPQGLRFLPGAIAIGEGPGIALQEDAQGRMWALLPWSGSLARIRAIGQ